MRWGLWLTVVLVLLLAAYMVWPLTGFCRIASAIEAKDAQLLWPSASNFVRYDDLLLNKSLPNISNLPAK